MKSSSRSLRRGTAIAGSLLLAFAFATGADAQQGNVSVFQNTQPNKAAALAQALRDMEGAKPFTNPLPPPASAATAVPGQSNPAYLPGGRGIGGSRAQGVAPGTRAYGSFGIPYANGRVAAGESNFSTDLMGLYLSTTYPYSAVGKLTFRAGLFSSFCTATLVLRSVIVTAAHCIQNFGSGSTLFTNWSFVPAFFKSGPGVAQRPYGTWNWASVARPTTWANGTDTGSGSARNNDLAIIVIEKNTSDQFLGDLIYPLYYGWNNYSFVSSSKTGNLSVAAVTTMGYPGLLDAGNIMQRADGPTYVTSVSGANQLYQGNPYTGGSSGGPWIVNFYAQSPSYSGGTNPGTADFPTMIVGVTSWGSQDPNVPKDNYSSQFGQNTEFPLADYGGYGAGNIGSLLNTACATIKSGTSSTFAQLGYCDAF